MAGERLPTCPSAPALLHHGMMCHTVQYAVSNAASACRRSRDCLQGLGAYYKLAVPSTLMVCLEWWAYELCKFM
jgi:hypothetical protein